MRKLLALLLILAPASGFPETVSKNFSGMSALELSGKLTDTAYKWCNFSMAASVDRLGRPEGHYLTVLNADFPTTITFTECNFTNRHPPSNAVMIRCNSTIRQSAVPLSTRGTPVYNEATKTTETVTVTTYEDRIHGKYDGTERVYKYFGTHRGTGLPVLDQAKNLSVAIPIKIETEPPDSDVVSIEKQRLLDEQERLEAELAATKAELLTKVDP